MYKRQALTYVSTEGEPAIKKLEAEQNEQVKKKGRKAEPREEDIPLMLDLL